MRMILSERDARFNSVVQEAAIADGDYGFAQSNINNIRQFFEVGDTVDFVGAHPKGVKGAWVIIAPASIGVGGVVGQRDCEVPAFILAHSDTEVKLTIPVNRLHHAHQKKPGILKRLSDRWENRRERV